MDCINFSSSDFSASCPAVHEAKNRLTEEGWFACRGLKTVQTLDQIRSDIGWLIKTLAEREGIEIHPTGEFDEGILDLKERDRQLAGKIYDAAGRLYAMHQLSVDPSLSKLSRSLMQCERIQSAFDKAVRIDYPGEDNYLFPWHQDYTYDPSSPGGLVYWIPLKDVRPVNGALKVAPRTHKNGIRDIRVIETENSKVSGAKMFEIADLSDIRDEECFDVEMDFGEFLVFDNLMLHRSQPNSSETTRWTIQVRHGNLEDPYAISKGWPDGNFKRRWFYETHPEKIVN